MLAAMVPLELQTKRFRSDWPFPGVRSGLVTFVHALIHITPPAKQKGFTSCGLLALTTSYEGAGDDEEIDMETWLFS